MLRVKRKSAAETAHLAGVKHNFYRILTFNQRLQILVPFGAAPYPGAPASRSRTTRTVSRPVVPAKFTQLLPGGGVPNRDLSLVNRLVDLARLELEGFAAIMKRCDPACGDGGLGNLDFLKAG